jgi:hypothetical protein
LTDPYHVQPLAYYQAKIAALYDALTGAVSWRNSDVLIPLTAVVGGWLIWSWSAQVRERRRWREMLWGLLVLLDVFAYAGWRHATDDLSWIIKSPPTAQLLQEDRAGAPYRLFGVVDAQAVTFHGDNLELLPANYVLITGLSSVGLYAPLGFDAYYRLMQRLGGVDLGFGYRPVSPDDITHDRALLDFINVRYVLSRQPLTGFTPIAQIGKVFVYQNDHALPRAFAVDRVESVASTDAALEWITAHPDQLRDTAVVEAPLPLRLDAGSAQGTTVSIADYRPTEVTIDIRAHGTLLLVLSDTYYPGWQAWLDERPTAIYRTQAVFRGVLVPAGSHRVRFRYVPTTFRRGLLIAGIGVLLFVGLIVASRRLTPADVWPRNI